MLDLIKTVFYLFHFVFYLFHFFWFHLQLLNSCDEILHTFFIVQWGHWLLVWTYGKLILIGRVGWIWRQGVDEISWELTESFLRQWTDSSNLLVVTIIPRNMGVSGWYELRDGSALVHMRTDGLLFIEWFWFHFLYNIPTNELKSLIF